MVATLLFLSLSLFLFIIISPIVGFAQSDHLEVPTIAQIPSVEEQSQRGLLILTSNVINDNGGSKQASDFIINILGSPAFPSSFKAAPSNLMQVISIQEGDFSISVNNTQGYDTSFGNQCEGQIEVKEVKTCLITVNDKGTTTTPPPPPPPNGNVDAKFSELIKRANPNEVVVLDGSGSTGTITSWSIVQTDGQPSVVLQNAPKPFSKQFIMPNTEDTLKFTLTVRNDQTGKQDTDTMTVSKTITTPPPPPVGNFPVPNVNWFYDSKNGLSQDMTLRSGTTPPQDRVLLSSGASGVSSHPIKNGWLEVQSGGGNGRVYWNYHEVPQFSQLPTAGFNTAMTGTFMFKPGIDNLSIKDGNHNTGGWSLEGQYAFGGFGLAFHRTDVESKAEYWHNNQGNGISVSYPNGLQLVDNKEYKFFLTLVTDRVKEEVVLNAWLDFGDGKGWIQVMKDRKWGHTGWSPGSVPNGQDKADILKGPSFIKKHHIWTRANGDSSLSVKDIMIGTLPFLS